MSLEHLEGTEKQSENSELYQREPACPPDQRLDNLSIKKIRTVFVPSASGNMEQMCFSIFLPLRSPKVLGHCIKHIIRRLTGRREDRLARILRT